MAYTMKVSGAEELSKMLTQLGDQAGSVAASGLYDGAGEMADSIKTAAGNIQTKPFHFAVFTQRDPSPEEKAIVEGAGLGIAKFDKNGSEVNTSVGYGKSGYAELAGKLRPIAKIANAINSGTSFLKKQPFFRKGVNSGKKKAEQAITSKIEQRFDEIINGGKTT